jgi:hypothetical protein
MAKQGTMEWHGVNRRESLPGDELRVRDEVAELAQSGSWAALVEALSSSPWLANTWQPGDPSLFAPLHSAAQVGAPAEVVERLIELGAWRTLRCAAGERAVDVARRCDHQRLASLLEPTIARPVPPDLLRELERHFHGVIEERARALIDEHALRLPALEPLTEYESVGVWFPIPGMSGGFAYKLADHGAAPRLITTSWSLAISGSGQWHEITSDGSRLVAKGFL